MHKNSTIVANRIGDVAKVISGYAFKSSEFQHSGIPVIKIRNVRLGQVDLSGSQFVDQRYLSLDKKYHVVAGDILVSLTGSHLNQPDSVVGRVARYPGKYKLALLNQRAGKVIVTRSDLCDSDYLYWVLFSGETRRQIATLAHGAANQANVSPSQIESIPIMLPSIDVQRKISSILSPYDDLIENNARRIKILEEMAETLYREWFVHFRFPGHEKVKLLETKIPQGWEAKKIGDVIELAYGRALKAEDRLGGPVPVFGSSGIIGFHSKPLAKGPGIIVGRKGNVGSVFWTDCDFYPIDTAFFVRTKLSLPYVFYNLQHQRFINNDAAVPGLSRRAAYFKPFVVPDIETLKAFEEVIIPIFSQLRVMREKSANLRHTRDLLLPKLVSGETLM